VKESVIDDAIGLWRRRLSPCLHSSRKRTFWIFTVTQITQNIIIC